MSDRRLQVFHAVAGVLSFTRAAESLHMTQPAVTHQIRQLEEELGTRLFDRANNRISLTDAGNEVLGYTSRILGLYSEMQSAVKTLTGERAGLVTLGASTTVAEYMLPELLGDFQRHFPDVRIRLRVANTDAVVAMVADNSIDLGVVEGAVDNGMLMVEECRRDELQVLVPPDHPLATADSVSPTDLLDWPFLFREDGSGTRSVIERYLEEHGIDVAQLERPFELGSTEAIKGAVQAGTGISILSRASLEKEISLGLLAVRPLAPRLERPYWFVRQRQKFRTRMMDELYQFARKYVQTDDS